MNNLRVHYDTTSIALIEARGASVKSLPPYSPDYNPIEKMWSKLKALLRGLAARTQQDLSNVITHAFAAISPSDAQGWFRSCQIMAILS